MPPGRICNVLWTFERMVDKELRSNVRDTIREVTKTDCEDLCLSENRFDCRSASYDHLTKECHLSADDRFTHPDAFVTKQGTDYLENQCQASKFICYIIIAQLVEIISEENILILIHLIFPKTEGRKTDLQDIRVVNAGLKQLNQTNLT